MTMLRPTISAMFKTSAVSRRGVINVSPVVHEYNGRGQASSHVIEKQPIRGNVTKETANGNKVRDIKS